MDNSPVLLTVGYTMDTMYFAWLDQPVQIDADLQLPQFSLQDKILYDCSQNYTAGATKVQMIAMHCINASTLPTNLYICDLTQIPSVQ